tara:strand:- start:184 stop:354 length:171 start_codon:yes stop_codon:yes gene_type:complete
MRERDLTIAERIRLFRKENEEDLKEGGCFEGWTDDDIVWQIVKNLKGEVEQEWDQI